MPDFVVLLRGVNVGKSNTLPMANFRAMLEGMGCGNVQTVLNSGNAVFSCAGGRPAKLAADIGAAIEERFGIVTPVVVTTAAEFALIANNNPIVPSAEQQSQFLVAFAMSPAKLAELAVVRALLGPGERFVVTPHAAYLHCVGGLLASRAGAALLGAAGKGITTRNWATTLKLLALLNARAA